MLDILVFITITSNALSALTMASDLADLLQQYKPLQALCSAKAGLLSMSSINQQSH